MATMPIIRMTTATEPKMSLDGMALMRLAAWLSPAFPIGAFACSHGLEYAVEEGIVSGRDNLETWARYLLSSGPVRQDGVLLARAWREADDPSTLQETAVTAAALKGTPELAQETLVQGEAFLRTVRAAWPNDRLEASALQMSGTQMSLPVAVGLVTSVHRIPLSAALTVFLHAFCANTVSAALRLSIIGQTDGQRVLAALETDIETAAIQCEAAGPDDLWAASPVLDWCSMRHETQHTRLFRS